MIYLNLLLSSYFVFCIYLIFISLDLFFCCCLLTDLVLLHFCCFGNNMTLICILLVVSLENIAQLTYQSLSLLLKTKTLKPYKTNQPSPDLHSALVMYFSLLIPQKYYFFGYCSQCLLTLSMYLLISVPINAHPISDLLWT